MAARTTLTIHVLRLCPAAAAFSSARALTRLGDAEGDPGQVAASSSSGAGVPAAGAARASRPGE